jgi:hypothetical protein
MRVRENLSGIVSSIGKNNSSPIQTSQIGKVYGIITTLNTPNKELFEQEGGFAGMGTVFYLNYSDSKNKNADNVDLNKCLVAKPYYSNIQKYPLIGELVELFDAPSPSSQVSNNSTQKYYKEVINVWNNSQQNSLTNDKLGKTFIESNDIRNLLSFEGDVIFQGRKGNGIRFGSTTKLYSDINEWSSVGNDGDPITILVNGYVTTDTGSNVPNIEEINKENSSMYMTSTQLIPLIPDRNDILNPITKPLAVNKYSNNQLLFNSDRIVINSKKDEVMIFAKTNIEINTKNVINLNANERIHLNSPRNFIGTKPNGRLPDEPLLLGNSTVRLLTDLIAILGTFSNQLTSAVTPPPGSPLIDVNVAGNEMSNALEGLIDRLDRIVSQQNFT